MSQIVGRKVDRGSRGCNGAVARGGNPDSVPRKNAGTHAFFGVASSVLDPAAGGGNAGAADEGRSEEAARMGRGTGG